MPQPRPGPGHLAVRRRNVLRLEPPGDAHAVAPVRRPARRASRRTRTGRSRPGSRTTSRPAAAARRAASCARAAASPVQKSVSVPSTTSTRRGVSSRRRSVSRTRRSGAAIRSGSGCEAGPEPERGERQAPRRRRPAAEHGEPDGAARRRARRASHAPESDHAPAQDPAHQQRGGGHGGGGAPLEDRADHAARSSETTASMRCVKANRSKSAADRIVESARQDRRQIARERGRVARHVDEAALAAIREVGRDSAPETGARRIRDDARRSAGRRGRRKSATVASAIVQRDPSDHARRAERAQAAASPPPSTDVTRWPASKERAGEESDAAERVERVAGRHARPPRPRPLRRAGREDGGSPGRTLPPRPPVGGRRPRSRGASGLSRRASRPASRERVLPRTEARARRRAARPRRASRPPPPRRGAVAGTHREASRIAISETSTPEPATASRSSGSSDRVGAESASHESAAATRCECGSK